MFCIYGYNWWTVSLGRNTDSRKSPSVSMVNAQTPPLAAYVICFIYLFTVLPSLSIQANSVDPGQTALTRAV